MKLKVLSSNSRGNCYTLEAQTGKLIIECGVCFKNIQKALDFRLDNVVGCLLSHSHEDHSKSIKEVLMAGLDCYMSEGTAKELGVSGHRVHKISLEMFEIGDFAVLPFEVQHDSPEPDPLGYLVLYKPTGEKLLFATDTYYIKHRFNGLNYIMVECNYCLDILLDNIQGGKISSPLKDRLLQSHFSLDNVKGFLKANDLRGCRKIVLLHLSDGNSDASRMIHEINELTGIETVIADPGEIDLELYPF